MFPSMLFAGALTSATPPPMPVIEDAELKHDTEILSSDAFGGRLPGTPCGDKAVAP